VSSYQWSNAQTLSCATCPSPVAHPKTETVYSVEVQNDGGCTVKENITVRVICNDGNLFIPNTFSPNADGRNDRFYPRGTGISSIKSLKVFNRWGEMVFSRESFNANDAAAGWDGIYKGTVLSPDVYVYTCEVVCMNNEVLLYRGDVTLLR
jgi:gliding motility-associated-like protein